MKNFLHAFMLGLLAVLSGVEVSGQTPMYSHTTGTGSNSFPLNSTASNKVQNVYTPAELGNMPSGTITKVYIKNNAAVTATTFTALTIKLGLVSYSSFASGTYETGLTTAYSQNTTYTNISADGWLAVDLTTPFVYNDSQNLLVEISQNGYTSGVTIRYNPLSAKRIYGGLAATTGTVGAGLTHFGVDLQTSPCTSPPTAGTAVASTLTGCSGVNFTLNLTGNSNGLGQTYQWQSSTDNATFTNIGTVANSSFLTTSQTISRYYRCLVTCSGNTDTSSAVQVTSPALVHGTFTINKLLGTSGTNFASINDAVNYIKCGIDGPVIFNVDAGTGPYDEASTIPAIAGASATNTVTFDGHGETISYNTTTTGARAALVLDGADYITVKNFNIDVTAGTYGWGIELWNQADYNTISNNHILAGNNVTTTNYAGIVISGSLTSAATSGNNGNYNTITGNTVEGGYYGIVAYGSTAPYNTGNIISSNILKDQYYYGIQVYGNTNILVSKNDISKPTRTTHTSSAYGIYLSGNGLNIEKNRVHNTHDAATSSAASFYPVYIASSGLVTAVNKLENNAIYNINNGGGTIYGVYVSSAYAYWNYYHNTISLDDQNATAGTTYGFYQLSSAANINFKNNIVSITRGGTGTKYCVNFATGSTIASNNNNLYNNAGAGTNAIGYYGAAYATLADWRTANNNAFDQASASTDPLYIDMANGDLRPGPTVSLANNIGANVGTATDILDVARGASPDPGAFEYSLTGCVNPPTPGTVESSAGTVSCAGTTFSMQLTGNSTGEGQTYQWQSSTDNVTFTNLSGVLNNSAYSTSQTVTTYYRCAVTCASGTTVYSNVYQVTTPALISGTFTINPSGTGTGNFTTFADAINYIKCGINGAVVFNVAAGASFNEQVIIPEITGTSATNTITINGNGAALNYTSTVTSERAIIKLKGTDYVRINNLNITSDGSTTSEYGYGIQLADDADNNIIAGCTININSSLASTNYAGIVITTGTGTTPTTAGDSQCDSNYIHNNTIIGGYYGITIMANGTTNSVYNNRVQENIVQDFYAYGIYLNGNINAIVSKNDILRPNRSNTTTFGGIYITTGCSGLTVNANKIHNTFDNIASSTSTSYGVYTSSDGTATSPNIFSNNMLYNFGGIGTQYGFYNVGSDYARYYYNSILLDGSNATTATYDTRGLYQTTAAIGIEYKNNIVSISRNCLGENHCIYINTATTSFESNNNNFYITTSGALNNVGYFASQYTDLVAWQAGTSKDANSYSVDPLFVAPDNLHLQASTPLDDKGVAISGVTTDIDNETRSVSTPDIGADELPPSAGLDMKTDALISPVFSAQGCYNTDSIIVSVKNNSINTINFATNPVTVTVNVTGAATAAYTATLNTGTLAANGVQNVTMATPGATLNMSATGTYNFVVNTAVAGDVNPANNSLTVNREKMPLVAPTISATSQSICIAGAPTLAATGGSGFSSYNWQSSTTAGTGFNNISGAVSSPYTGANITATTYYRLLGGCGNNTVTSNEIEIVYNNPQITGTTPGTNCAAGTVTLNAAATSGATINWYTAANGGVPVATGSPFVTPSISTTTNYYVSASAGGNSGITIPGDGGWNHFTATGSFQATTIASAYMILTVVQPFTLSSMDIYPSVAVGTSFSIEARTGSASGTSAFTYTGTTTVTNSGTPSTEQTVPVNWQLTPGTYYIGFTSNPSSWRSGAVTHTFPWTLPGVASVDYYLTPSYQYYFYNLKLATGCESPRTAVTATIGCATPVSLLNFSGEKKTGYNILSWKTATESNNSGFELQRSADGINFGKVEFIASKATGGNSSQPLGYSFDDTKPFTAGSYYRLKQIDIDGKATYSNIVYLKGLKVDKLQLTNLFPNPAVSVIKLSLIAPKSDKIELLITDVTGRIIKRQQAGLSSGDNTIEMNVQQLTAGTYFVKAICEDGCETVMKKFIKQ